MEAPPPTPDGIWGWIALGSYIVGHALSLIVRHVRASLRGRDIRNLEQRVDRLERQQDSAIR